MRVKLGDIFEIGSGGTPSKSHPEYYDGDIPWVKTGDLKSEYLYEVEDFITEDGLKNSSAKLYETDTVLIAMYGATIGATSILKMSACTNQACAAFKKNDKVIPEYLYYFLKSQKEKFVKDGVGGAQPNISAGYLKKVEMELPSLEEQKAIVDILDKTSNVVCKRNEEIQSLDELIKARFVEFFGDRYVNDKNWNTTKLGESISFNNGKAHEQVVDENGEYILVTSRAIASDFEDVRRTNTLLFPLHKNDIVMVMSDVPNGKALAKCQLIDSDDKYTLNQRICSFDNYEYDPIFLLHLLNRHPYFLSFNDGNGQTNLRKNDILECELIVPPMELQEQFAAFVHQVDKSKVAVQKALEETQLLFDSLMQKYFG